MSWLANYASLNTGVQIDLSDSDFIPLDENPDVGLLDPIVLLVCVFGEIFSIFFYNGYINFPFPLITRFFFFSSTPLLMLVIFRLFDDCSPHRHELAVHHGFDL